MDASRGAKITLAAIIGVWIGLAAAVAQPAGADLAADAGRGILSRCRCSPPRLRPHGRGARRELEHTPCRSCGAPMWCAFSPCCSPSRRRGRLSVRSAQRRWGDIITGVVAVPLLWLLKDGVARHRTAITAWNLFGTADLVLAIGFASPRPRARPCSCSPPRARRRCSLRRGPSFRPFCSDLADPARDHRRAAAAGQTPVARMERSENPGPILAIRPPPDFASLHPASRYRLTQHTVANAHRLTANRPQ